MKYKNIIYDSNLDVLKLNISFPHKEIYEELKEIRFSVKQANNKLWRGITLRGFDENKPRPYYEYGFKKDRDVPYKWTTYGNKCKISKQFISSLFQGCDLFRIKVNVLHPGGKIHLHNDSVNSGLGLSDKTSDPDVSFVTFAVHWPKAVIFNLNDKRIPIKTGDVYLLNFSKMHEVFNPTNEIRYYLLVTGRFHDSPFWQEKVLNSYSLLQDSTNLK